MDWTGLIESWNLDEASGDRAGQLGNYDLTDNGTVTSTTGLIGNASDHLAANSEFLSAGATSLTEWTSATQASISFWAKRSSGTHYIAVGASGSSTRRFYVTDHADGNLYAMCSNGTGTFGSVASTSVLNQWNHYVVSFDGTQATDALKLKLWLNGVQQTLALTGPIPSALPNSLQGPFRIGVLGSTYCTGQYDSVQPFSRPLVQQDVDDLYNGGAGLVFSTPGILTEEYHTRDSVGLEWTDSVGMVGTVTTQLQISPADAETWTNVPGATSSPGLASGLSEGTEYDFRVAVTDDNGTVYTDTVSVETYVSTTYYLQPEATGTDDGSSWENAFTTWAQAQVVMDHAVDLYTDARQEAPLLGGMNLTSKHNWRVIGDQGPNGVTWSTNGRTSEDWSGPSSSIFSLTTTEPTHVVYDFKQDDIDGTVTGVAIDEWKQELLTRWGHDPNKARAYYGFMPKTSGTQTAPGEGEYGYSGGVLYVHPPGSPDLATFESLCQYCIGNVTGIQANTSNDWLVGDGINWILYPGAGSNDGYAVKNQGGARTTIRNMNAWAMGWHSFGSGSYAGRGNVMYNLFASGCTTEDATAGNSNPYVSAISEEEGPEGYENDLLVANGVPRFLTTGLPSTLAWHCQPFLSHSDGGATISNGVWNRLLALDYTALIEAKHSINTSITTSPLAIAQSNGNYPDRFDGDQFPCKCYDSAFVGIFAFGASSLYERCINDRQIDGVGNLEVYYTGTNSVYVRDSYILTGEVRTGAGGTTADVFENITANAYITYERTKILRQLKSGTSNSIAGVSSTGEVLPAIRFLSCEIENDGTTVGGILKATTSAVSAAGFDNVLSDGGNIFGLGFGTLAFTDTGTASLANIAAWNSTIDGGSTDQHADLGWGATATDKRDFLRDDWWVVTAEAFGEATSNNPLINPTTNPLRNPISNPL